MPGGAGGRPDTEAARIAPVWGIAAAGILTVVSTSAARWTIAAGQGLTQASDVLLCIVGLLVGARVISHAPRNACGWLMFAIGALAAVNVISTIGGAPILQWLHEWAWWPSYTLLALALALFPTGRSSNRLERTIVRVLAVCGVASTVALISLATRSQDSLVGATGPVVSSGADTWLLVVSAVGLLIGAVTAVITSSIRISRAETSQRGPLVLGAIGLVLLLSTMVVDAVVGMPGLWLVASMALPVAIAIGTARYGLYDIDMLIHRTLLYGLLTAAVIGSYVGVVELSTLVAPSWAAPIAATAAVLVALPLRDALQTRIERGIYGYRGRPYDLVTSLGRHVGGALTPNEVLATAVSTVESGLKLPFVAIEFTDVGVPVAAAGRKRDWDVTELPLAHRGEQLGQLVVQRRSPDEPWSRRERALLADLALQIGPSVAAVRLAYDLQTARERLVLAREEERRRLRRDLHDGVGPAISASRMQARAGLGATTIQGAHEALRALDRNLVEAGAEVRQVVDGLRPAALDRGLRNALETLIGRYRNSGLMVTLSVGTDTLDLPAAVDVAMYRVVDEAITNTAKHARAAKAEVRLERSGSWLRLTVTDDGSGMGTRRDDGVGLDSMRERCEELGGLLTLETGPRGTALTAHIPVR